MYFEVLFNFFLLEENTKQRHKVRLSMKENDPELNVVTGLACGVYPVCRLPPPARFHSRTEHFVSSFYTRSYACDCCLYPLLLLLVPETGTGTCCPGFPSVQGNENRKKKHSYQKMINNYANLTHEKTFKTNFIEACYIWDFSNYCGIEIN